MTVQTTEQDRASSAWSDEAEIDLRQYIEVLVRWRREILLITLLTIILAIAAVMGLQWLSTPMYEASAEVAIVRTVSDIQFDERFRTTAEESTQESVSARRLALVVLANSPSIAQEVGTQLADQLNENERWVDALLGMVEASVSSPEDIQSNNSDLIRIKVTASSPEKAAAIANAWAEIFVRRANTVYGQVPDGVFTSLKAELANAENEYAAAQANLEQFLAESRSDELNRQITEQQALIDAYSANSAANRLTAFSAEQAGQRNTLSAYLSTLSGVQTTLFEEQAKQDTRLLRNYYSKWITTTLALDDAHALRLQVEQGGDAAARTSALALQLLKIKTLGAMPENVELQLTQVLTLTSAEMLGDIDGLITALETRQDDLENHIEQLATVMLSGDNFAQLGASIPVSSTLAQTIQKDLPILFALGNFTQQSEVIAMAETAPGIAGEDSLTQKLAESQAELRSLKSQFEADSALQRQLTQQRDLTWETFKTLSNKVAELNLTRAASNSEVRFAATAVPPVDPVEGQSMALAVAAAGIVGLTLSVLIALVADYMEQPPFLTRNRPSPVMAIGR